MLQTYGITFVSAHFFEVGLEVSNLKPLWYFDLADEHELVALSAAEKVDNVNVFARKILAESEDYTWLIFAEGRDDETFAVFRSGFGRDLEGPYLNLQAWRGLADVGGELIVIDGVVKTHYHDQREISLQHGLADGVHIAAQRSYRLAHSCDDTGVVVTHDIQDVGVLKKRVHLDDLSRIRCIIEIRVPGKFQGKDRTTFPFD